MLWCKYRHVMCSLVSDDNGDCILPKGCRYEEEEDEPYFG